MSGRSVRRPYRNYAKQGTEFLPIFIEIKAADAIDDSHFITDYCKGKKIEPKTLRDKYNKWLAAGEPAVHQTGVVDGLSSARGETIVHSPSRRRMN